MPVEGDDVRRCILRPFRAERRKKRLTKAIPQAFRKRCQSPSRGR